MNRLNEQEFKAVIFSIEQDLDILSNSIKESNADPEWKRQYQHLSSAHHKLTGKPWPNSWAQKGAIDE